MSKCTVLVLALVACSAKSRPDDVDRSPRDARAEPKPTRSVDLSVVHLEEPVIVLPRQDTFTLLDAGTGPKAALRYQLAPGNRNYRATTTLVSRRLAAGNWEPSIQLPPLRDGFELTVDADATRPMLARPLAAEITGTSSPLAEQYLTTWRAIENRRLTIGFDARGQLGAITFSDDPTAARSGAAKDELVQRLLATVIPVPDEPVATGASWRVVTVLRQRPAIVKQTATYTLVGRTASAWKIAVHIQRIAEQQLITDPALPKGSAANLLALVRKLDGSVEVDPRHPLPDGTLQAQSTIHVRIATEGHIDEQILDDTGTIKLSSD